MRRLWYHGKIVSMDGQMRQYEALGTQDDTIVFLGTAEEALAQQWDEKTDLEGALMLPGFMDTHMHMLYYGQIASNVDLFGLPDIDAVVEKCRAHIEATHARGLVGWGWNQETMAEQRYLTKDDIDRISTDIPIMLRRTCGHIAACNTKMLEALLALDMDDQARALIDVEHGILRESAAMQENRVMPALTEEEVRGLIRTVQKELNSAGLTCIHSHDLGGIPGVDDFDLVRIFRSMSESGELTVRVYEQAMIDQERFPALAAQWDAPDAHESLFRLGTRKLVGDGSLGAKSAAMINGYVDDPDNHGIPLFTDEEMYENIKAAHSARISAAVHAIGDLTLRQVCDAVERCQKEDPWPEARHGIIHAQITSPELLERMRDLGLQAYVQPIFIDADMEIINERVGEAHARDCYNWKTMLDLGIHVSGGTDCPVEPFSVLDNLRAAVTRKNRKGDHVYLPDQALTPEEAIRLVTADAAWASRDEDVRGTLEVGKQADLVVVDQDLFTMDPGDYTKANILETVLNGRTVYRA